MSKSSKRPASPSVKELEAMMAELGQLMEDKRLRMEAERERKKKEEDDSSDTASAASHNADLDGLSDGEGKENAKAPEHSKNLGETDSSQKEEFVELDEETLELLDDDGSSNKEEKFVFHPKLAGSWEKILTRGLKKEKRVELLDKYPRRGNCPIVTPKLDSVIEASLNETSKKRDKFFVNDLELCGAGLSALGTGITMIFNSQLEEINTKDLIATLADAGKLLCELHQQLIKARKAFIYPSLDKKAKAVLESSQSGEYLFGPELPERLRSAKAVEKLSLSLKPPAPEKRPVFRVSSNLNWRGPSANNRGQGQAGYRNMGNRQSQPHQRHHEKRRAASQGRAQNMQPQEYPANPPIVKK